jgi:hypothetical protein
MALPKILDIGFKIDDNKLWELDIPTEEINISDIYYNLDIPYLERMGTDDWNLSPRMLIENFDKEKLHASRTKKVDLKYPIEIYKHQDKWIILDGVHRFTKAVLEGDKTIKVRKVTDEIIAKNREIIKL